jgi:chemotaxis protein histidine kinase CheA
VADDGAGLDVERIAEKAVENGIVRAEQVATMDSATSWRWSSSPASPPPPR